MNRYRILMGFIFVIAGLMVGTTFVTAVTYFQLAVAVLLYPVLILFFFWAFPRAVRVISPRATPTMVLPQGGPAEKKSEIKRENMGIIDIDKRAFLKLIGGAGIALFLFSVFNKRIENLFFNRNLPASEKVPQDAIADGKNGFVQNQILNGYNITEIEDNVIAFHGFTNKNGAWYIMRADTNTGSFRYATGGSDFSANWANRTNLKYDYYSNAF